ncbi:MAG: hypothetical protein HY774_27065 [Acidobacteria bacterium]|nr:hypothetical protein [Acidobacteriota bacterium]
MIASFCPLTVKAQYYIDTWTTENGLPQNSITSLVQTRDGYLWFGTTDGLVRFDGVKFKVFNKANSEGLGSNRISQILEDRSGRLWITTEDGRLLYYKQGAFTAVLNPNDPQYWPRRNLVDDGHGSILFYKIETRQTFQFRDGKLVPFELPGMIPGTEILYVDRSGGYWMLDGLDFHRVKDGRRETYSTLPSGKTKSVYEDRFGHFWLTTGLKDIYRVQGNRIERFESPVTGLWGCLEDQAGNLWFKTFNEGVLRIEASEVHSGALTAEKFRQFTDQDGMLNNIGRNLVVDREGGVWVGTEKGLHHFYLQSVEIYSKKDGLESDNVYPILEDRNGAIWFGGWPFSLMKFHNGDFSTVVGSNEFPHYSALFEAQSGTIWVGNDENTYYLEHETPVIFTAANRPGFKLNGVNVISQTTDGAMWFGTGKGLVHFSSGQVRVFTTSDGLPDNFIVALIQARDGKLWVGTRGGIACLENGVIRAFTEKDGLASNYTRCLYEDTDGLLWIGSYDGGLTRYFDGQFTRFTMFNGLHSNGVFCILEDSRGWFWMNSNQGIYRVRKQELNDFAEGKTKFLNSIAYGKKDGLINIEGNGGRQPAGIKARDGKMWFPMAQGIAVIDPEKVTVNPLPPLVLIEEFSIDRTPIPNDNFQSAIKSPHTAIRIDPYQNNLEIQYTGLSFIDSNQVKFKFKLEGWDPDWIEAGTRRTAYYSYLPAGEYTFQVKAANRDGAWAIEPATVKVKVLPFFYQTWWFYSLVFGMLSSVVFLVFRFRLAQIEEKHREQEAFSRKLIDSQELERKRIAAELHDSLGQSLVIIKNRARLGLKPDDDLENKENQLDGISMAATQAIEELREISFNLRPYLLDKIGLTRTLKSMLGKVFPPGETRVIVEIDELDDVFSKDSEILFYRIIQESVNNIVKHAQATQAHISIKRVKQSVVVTIEDNGKGFDLTDTRLTTQQSFGLIGIAERARLLGGNHSITSEIGRGTTVTITVDLSQENL